jgi:hypothetical protein
MAKQEVNYSWCLVVSFIGFCQPNTSVGFVDWLDCSDPTGRELRTFSPSHHFSHGGIVFLESATVHHDDKWQEAFFLSVF